MAMAKYNKTLVAEITEWVKQNGLIDYGGAMLKDFCVRFHLDNKTYYHWMKKPEFKEAVNAAKEVFKTNLTHDLVTSLAMTAKGYEREDTVTEYKPNPKDPSKPLIAKMVKKTVHYQPNVASAIFLLTNLDPEHFQNKQRTDVAIKKDDDREMTIEEINKEIERLDKLEKEKEKDKDKDE